MDCDSEGEPNRYGGASGGGPRRWRNGKAATACYRGNLHYIVIGLNPRLRGATTCYGDANYRGGELNDAREWHGLRWPVARTKVLTTAALQRP